MWKNMKINVAIVLGFCFVFILFGFAIYFGYTGLTKVVDRSSKSDDMQSIVKNILEARRNEKNLLLRSDPSYRDKTLTTIAEIKRQALVDKERFQQLDNKQLMDDVIASVTIYETSFKRLAEVFLAGDAQKAELAELDKKMVASARKAQDACEAAMKDQKMEMSDAVIALKINFSIFTILALLVGGVAAFLITRSIEKSIMEMVNSAHVVADGNLAINHFPEGSNEMGQLARSFNGMIDSVTSVVQNVTATAAKVSVSAYRIHAAADLISGKAAEAATQAANVATSSKEMAGTSENIAQSCQLAAEGAQRASHSAQKGSVVVENTVQVMRQIAATVQESSKTVTTLGERSNQIGEIINTIKDIASQTNLLALNAAIEAARAGDQGRGFAVVADEVRALSERTTKAAYEIGEMIESIQSETKEAVVAMAQGMQQVETGTIEASHSGSALQDILEQVNAVAQQVSQIVDAVKIQTDASGEISRNIETITSAIQDTASESELSAKASSEMNAIAEELMADIGKFKIEEDANLAINKAKSAHMIFIGKIIAHLNGSANIDANALPTHLTCAFGKWYQGKGREACGRNSLFSAIDAPHAKVHDFGKQAIIAYNAGDKIKARSLCSQMEACSMELVGILNQLNDSIAKGAV
jgi:methyl-accepting chemotaxis protein